MAATSRLNLRLRWKQQDPARQGVMMFLGIFIIIVLCGFAAFAIDLGYISLTQAQLQNAADAAALAAVLELKTSDPNLTVSQMKANAMNEALKAAAFNYAAQRSVVLDPNQVKFGNRHYGAGGTFVTSFENDAGYDNTQPLNAVKVDVTYGEDTGPRRKLDLWFARLLHQPTAVVSGYSRAHLTPRDLVFCLDISNSMNDDVEGSGTEQTDRITMIRKWLDLPDAMTDAEITTAPASGFTSLTPYGTGSNANRIFANANLTISALATSTGFTPSTEYLVTASAAHNLADGDQVTISGFTNASNRYGYTSGAAASNINQSWWVTVRSATTFTLNGSVFPSGRTFESSKTAALRGVFPTSTGGIRVRTVTPHGLLTGNLISMSGVTGSGNVLTALNRVFTITRVNNYNTNESNRFDATGATWSGSTYTNSSTYPTWQIPDISATAAGYTLTTAQRLECYKRYWLRFIDHNGTTVTSVGTNRLHDMGTVAHVAAIEFASGQTDATYNENVDHPFYVSYSTSTTSGTPSKGTPTGPAIQYPQGHPWLSWKWRAFVDSQFSGTSGQAQYTFNKNVVATTACGTGKQLWLDRYALWALGNGCVPALAGQGFFGRDCNNDNTVDSFSPVATMLATSQRGSNTFTDYPNFSGYYPRPAYQHYRDEANVEVDYDETLIDFVEGTANTGLHPDNVPDLPFSFVRQATLNGINAMISDENAGNDAFDQVAMVTFGTRAYVESDLTNDLPTSLKLANNRLCVATSNLSVTPYGNGNTNIGGAIRKALDVLLNQNGYTRGRTYTNKTIALLTDGVPNIMAAGGNTAPELIGNSDSLSSSGGSSYAQYWADQCSTDKVVLHTIGFGTGSDATFLQDLATRTGGQFFPITNPAAQVDDLNNIFIAIGKDKLGKLFTQ